VIDSVFVPQYTALTFAATTRIHQAFWTSVYVVNIIDSP